MTLTRKQRIKRLNESPSKKRSREKIKEKKETARMSREGKMAGYLKSKGWTKTPRDQWSIPGWQSDDICIKTLHQAHKIQLKLDSEGYTQPIRTDDDLASSLLE